MAKQNLSKKGVQRFNRKKLPKDAVRKNANLRLQHREAAQSRAQQQQQASKQQKADGKRKGGDPQALPQSFVRGKQVLLVGEGNLSFAHALVAHVLGGDGRGVTATTYDTEEEKYGEAAPLAAALVGTGAVVGYGIDAMDLGRCLKALRKRVAASAAAAQAVQPPSGDAPAVPAVFDRIVFNFPHRGAGIKDQDANVRTNQELLLAFFSNAAQLLAPGGEILVTIKTGAPYTLWNVPKLASQGSRNVLRLHTAMAFESAAFPGYAHRHTHGDDVSRPTDEELAGGARTYIWRAQPQ